IWVQSLDSRVARAIAGTEGGGGIFWSPDGRTLGFFAQEKLKRVPAGGGPVQVLCDAPPASTGAWNQAGAILFSQGHTGALYQVPESGAAASQVTRVETRGHSAHAYPCFLPDGRSFLFTATGSQPSARGIYAGSLDGRAPRLLMPIESNARYISPGRIVFRSPDGTLMAQPFDARSWKLEGDPIPIATHVSGYEQQVVFDVSEAGTLVYAEEYAPNNQLAWFDRAGKRSSLVGSPGPFIHMDLAKDQSRVLLERYENGAADLWILDLHRGVPARFTYGQGWA